MKTFFKIFLLVCGAFFALQTHAQKNALYGNPVVITSRTNDTATVYLNTPTKTIDGILWNAGNGRLEYRLPLDNLIVSNDSIYYVSISGTKTFKAMLTDGSALITELNVQDDLYWKNDSTLGSHGIDSLRDNSGVQEAYKDGAWIPQFTLPSGGGSGGTNSNIGSAYRWAVPGSNNIKTFHAGLGFLIDSAAHTNELTGKVDTAYLNSLYANTSDTTQISNVDYLDSTGATQWRPLLSLPGRKIGTSSKFVVDTTKFKLVINNKNVSFGGANAKLAVNGNGYFNGTLKIGAYTLPATDGSNNYVLKTDGSGNVGWQADAGITSEADPLSVHITDSAAMLAHYFRTSDFNGTFDTRFSTKTTDNLSEGSTNKYYTDPRARGALSVLKAPLSYNSSTGVFDFDSSHWHSKAYYDGVYQPLGSYLTSYTETDPLSVHITDSAAMLAHYLRSNVAAATYVPLIRTITINGTAYDLSADRSWTISGGSAISNVINSGIRLINPTKDSAYTVFGTIGNCFDSTTNAKGITLNIKGAPLADSALTGTSISWWGSSITLGASAATGLEYAAYVCRSLNISNTNNGVSGTTFVKNSNGDNSFVDKWSSVPSYSSSIRYIVIGGDYAIAEMGKNRGFQTYIDTLSAYIDSLNLHKGYPLNSIVLTTPNPIGLNNLFSGGNKNNDSLLRWVTAIKTVAANKKVLLVDMWTYLTNNGNKLLISGDSVDPTSTGHYEMYKAFVASLTGGVISNSSIFANGYVHLGTNAIFTGTLRWPNSGSSVTRELWADLGGTATTGLGYIPSSGRTVIWSRPNLELMFENGGNQLSTTTSNCAFYVSTTNGFVANKVSAVLPFAGLNGNQISGTTSGTNQSCGIGYNANNAQYIMYGRNGFDGSLMFGSGQDATTMTTSNASFYVNSSNRVFFNSKINFDATNTTTGTTGAQTINKPSGSVNFAASATSLVVTNSLVTTTSIIIPVVQTNDANTFSVRIVPASGSFTIYIVGTAPAAETRVAWVLMN